MYGSGTGTWYQVLVPLVYCWHLLLYEPARREPAAAVITSARSRSAMCVSGVRNLMPAYRILLLLLLEITSGGADTSVTLSNTRDAPLLDIDGMKALTMHHDKAILLMFSGGCESAASFAPTLDDVAKRVSGVAFGRIDVGNDSKVKIAAATGVSIGSPMLKAFFR